jgi:hypothetical protein
MCKWTAVICRSQSKVHAKAWYVNVRASALAHSCLGQSPENVTHCQGRCAYLLQQPEVLNILAANSKISARHLSQALFSLLGQHVPKETARDMLLTHRRSTSSLAEKDLCGIGKFCQAFIDCNPGTVMSLEVDGDGAFHRFYACPGVHDSVVTCLLPISFSDGYHGRNKEFRYQVIGNVALTNQRTAFIHAMAIVPVENADHWTWFNRHLEHGNNMGRRLHSGKVLLMGDREKGELLAGQTVFPEANPAACRRHIQKIWRSNILFLKRAVIAVYGGRSLLQQQ